MGPDFLTTSLTLKSSPGISSRKLVEAAKVADNWSRPDDKLGTCRAGLHESNRDAGPA
jgi:hypothetical protein